MLELDLPDPPSGDATLVLGCELPAPPEAVWPWVSEASKLSAWSDVVIEAVSPGPSGAAVEAGAVRTVRIPVGPLSVTAWEVLTEVLPGERLVYRVFRGGGLRNHLGRIELEALPGGRTALSWRVWLVPWLPGAAPVVAAVLRPQFARGFEVLAGLVAEASRLE